MGRALPRLCALNAEMQDKASYSAIMRNGNDRVTTVQGLWGACSCKRGETMAGFAAVAGAGGNKARECRCCGEHALRAQGQCNRTWACCSKVHAGRGGHAQHGMRTGAVGSRSMESGASEKGKK